MKKRVLVGLGLFVAAGWVGVARGQDTAGMGTTNGLPPGYATNPFASPYANPFMNPYAAAAGPVSRDQLLLFFLAARQERSVRGRGAAPVRPVAEMPYHLMRPGGTASSSYFNRTSPVSTRGPSGGTSVPNPYGRYGNYFRNNGR